MFDASTIHAVRTVAREMGWGEANLLAVCEVESGGVPFAVVGGRQEPVIGFEGHYFFKRLSGLERVKARREGLASPVAGEVKNPKTQAARWQMLNRAIAIDANAALESCSWGLGQVMGAHWRWLGYASVTAMVNDARSGVAGQVSIMAKFIEKSGLDKALIAQDWAGFAIGYNGPQYRKNQYDVKLRQAYDKWVKKLKALPFDEAVKVPAAPAGEIAKPSVATRGPEHELPPVPTAKSKGLSGIQSLIGMIMLSALAFYQWLAHLPCALTGWDIFCK